MTTTREPESADLRLLDVLLEEALAPPAAATRAATTPRRGPLLAAALILLGTGVVLGVLATRGGAGASGAIAPQDPQDPARETLEPTTPQELEGLLSALEAVVVWPPPSDPTARFAAGPHAVPAPMAEPLQIREPTELVQWIEELRASTALPAPATARPGRPSVHVGLQLFGRRQVVLQFHRTNGALSGAGVAFAADPRLRARIEAAAQAAEELGRRGAHIAVSADDLRLLPTTLRHLECRDLAPDVLRAGLPRFEQLESLRCVVDTRRWQPSVQDADVLPILAALPRLRRLAIAACFVTPTGLGATPAWPSLEELEVVGQARTPSFKSNLDLTAPSPFQPAARQLPAILPRLPNLRVLRLIDCTGAHPTIEVALHSHLRELHLVGTGIALDDLRRLAELPTLRALTFDLTDRNDDAAVLLQALGSLQQLRQLEVIRGIARIVGDFDRSLVQRALPLCEVEFVTRGGTTGELMVQPPPARNPGGR